MKYTVHLKAKYSSAEIVIPAYSTTTLDLLVCMLRETKTKDGDPVDITIYPIIEEEIEKPLKYEDDPSW